MVEHAQPILILMAEDDPDDRLLVQEAFEESHLANELRFVEDGEELMDYLRQQGPYSEPRSAPRPDLILLDLNMPRKDGREALLEIKQDQRLCCIPVVVLTTSGADEDVIRSYQTGVNSFIKKPVTFERMLEVMNCLGQYWLQIVALPPADS